jgi:hypothetical protein
MNSSTILDCFIVTTFVLMFFNFVGWMLFLRVNSALDELQDYLQRKVFTQQHILAPDTKEEKEVSRLVLMRTAVHLSRRLQEIGNKDYFWG